MADLDRLLEPERFDDYCVNGLQVPGSDTVATVATGVSAHAELFEQAAAEQADLVLVHHGLIWRPGVMTVDAMLARRLKLLLDANMALAAYHLPLDAHPQYGNNALLAQALLASDPTPFAMHHGQPIGFVVTLPGDGLPVEELTARVWKVTRPQTSAPAIPEPLVFDAGPSRIRRLAIVSGGGADYIVEAAEAGADALLTGEPIERSMALARETGIHLIAAGHYATETLGVRRLGEYLAARFDLRHVFIEVLNPV